MTNHPSNQLELTRSRIEAMYVVDERSRITAITSPDAVLLPSPEHVCAHRIDGRPAHFAAIEADFFGWGEFHYPPIFGVVEHNENALRLFTFQPKPLCERRSRCTA